LRGEALAEGLSSLRLDSFPSVPVLRELRNLLTLVSVLLLNVQINTLLVADSTLASEVVVGLITLFFDFSLGLPLYISEDREEYLDAVDLVLGLIILGC